SVSSGRSTPERIPPRLHNLLIRRIAEELIMDNIDLQKLVEKIDAIDKERDAVSLDALRALKQVDHEVWALAVDVFDKEQQAAGWCSDNIPVLGNRMPFRLVTEGKRDEVIDCLYRIQHGFFA